MLEHLSFCSRGHRDDKILWVLEYELLAPGSQGGYVLMGTPRDAADICAPVRNAVMRLELLLGGPAEIFSPVTRNVD